MIRAAIRNATIFITSQLPTSALCQGSIDGLLNDGGHGYYRCSFKGVEASSKCFVTFADEKISLPDYKRFYNSDHTDVLTINWPDGDVSKYAFGDSDEMWNLKERTASYTTPPGDSDWSNGITIFKDGKSWVRLWQ